MPIENEKNRCIACGAPLNIPVQGGRLKCDFCGAEAVYTPKSHNKDTELVCPKCGAMLPREAEHCTRCGLKLEFNCPKCGARNAYGANFCVKCGINIPQELDRQQQERQRLEEQQRKQAAAIRVQMDVQQAAQRRKNRIVFIVMLVFFCLAAVAALAIGGVVYQTRYSPAAIAAQRAVAEPILREVDPRSLMPSARYDIWEPTLTYDQVTTNLDSAESYPAGDQFGRITGHRQNYTDSDYCNPTWDVIFQYVQVVIFEDSAGALQALDHFAGESASDYKIGDEGYIRYAESDTGSFCSVPFNIRWATMSFTRYNVLVNIDFGTPAVGGEDNERLIAIAEDTAREIMGKIDTLVGR